MEHIQGRDRNQIRTMSLEEMVEKESMVSIIDALRLKIRAVLTPFLAKYAFFRASKDLFKHFLTKIRISLHHKNNFYIFG